MADRAKKISELTVATGISGTDLIPIVANTSGTPVTKSIAYSDFITTVLPVTNTYILFGANNVASGIANLTYSGGIVTVGNSSVRTTISSSAVGGNASYTIGNTTINGTLLTGNTSIVGDATVSGVFTSAAANVILGSTGLGNAVIKLYGAVSSNVGPDTPNNYFLGNTSHPWGTIWVSTIRTADISYSDSDVVIQMAGNTASYFQSILQNKSSSANASTNYNVSSDTATATTNYGEFGINSAFFVGDNRFADPLCVYMGAATSNLAIGTYGNYPVNIVVNSSDNTTWNYNIDGSMTLPRGPMIFTGNATTRVAVNTQVGTAGSNGSIYLSTAGKMYLRVDGTGVANTDWQRVTTTAVD